jgi:YihY family inner membrane protein
MAATGNLKNRAIQTIGRLRERSRSFDLAARGFGRYQRTEGPVSAVHVAYSAFFSIFPLLFVAVGVLGLVLRGNPELSDKILDAARDNLPEQLHTLVDQSVTSARSSARTALGVGLLLLLYSGTGMVVALERGLSRAFGLERAGSFLRQRTRALGWLVSVGLLLVLSVASAGLVRASGVVFRALGIGGTPAKVSSVVLAVALGFVVDVALFTLTFVLLPNRALRPRQVLPGAVLCAVWWGLLKSFGALYVGRAIQNAGEVFGQLAVVVGLLVFVNLAAQLLMLTASIQAELVLGPPAAAAPTVGLVEAARGHPPAPAGDGSRPVRLRLAAAGALLGWLSLRGRRRRRLAHRSTGGVQRR